MNAPALGLSQTSLVSLVAARMCHDLVSPLGAIGNGIELLQMAQQEAADHGELALVVDSLESLRARIAAFRMAFGPSASEHRISDTELRSLLGRAASARTTVEFAVEGDLARGDGKMVLLALMCIETAIPWCGRVLICRTGPGWRLVADAARTRPDPALWSWLGEHGGEALRPPPAPAEVQFPLLAAEAAACGRVLGWEVDATGAEISF